MSGDIFCSPDGKVVVNGQVVFDPAYVKFFATFDWILNTVTGFYDLDIFVIEHNKGQHPLIQVYELVSGGYDLVTLQLTRHDTHGNIKLSCIVPFSGKAIIQK